MALRLHSTQWVTQTDTLRNPLDPKANIHYLSYQPAPLVLASSEFVSDCSKWDFSVSDTWPVLGNISWIRRPEAVL